MSITFIGIWLFSITDQSKNSITEKRAFNDQFFRSQTAIGINTPIKH
jgi:cation/acetate symporter